MKDPKFWHQKWQAGEIGFHQDGVHKGLEKYWRRLKLKRRSTVFVPLCGKSNDMVYLRERGHDVVGVELSEIAAEQFFTENNLRSMVMPKADFNYHIGNGLTLLQGDFFKLGLSHMRKVRAVYDRAALIALPVDMRTKYAAHLKSILAPETQILLITLEYDQSQMDGPPFNVSEDEVTKLFGEWCEIEKFNSGSPEMFKDKVEAVEGVYYLTVN